MPERKKTTKKTKKEKTGKYALTATVNGITQSTDTDDIATTLMGWAIPFVKTHLVVSLTYEAKTTERILNVAEARRVFNNKLVAQTLAENMQRLVHG